MRKCKLVRGFGGDAEVETATPSLNGAGYRSVGRGLNTISKRLFNIHMPNSGRPTLVYDLINRHSEPGKSIMWKRILWLYGLCVAVAIFLAPDLTYAKPVPCKTDGGKTWYFSIGKTVFYLTDFDLTILGSEADDIEPDNKLFPPNPEAPEGCKDDPQQLRYFRPEGWPRLQSVGYAGDLPVWADTLSLERFPPPDGDSPDIDLVIFFREESVSDCKNKKYLTRYDDGTILCTDQSGEQNSNLLISGDPWTRNWEFILSAKRYSTPLGDNLVVDNGITGPSASYLFTSDVVLSYSWWIIGRQAPVDPTYLIRVDQSIISALQNSEINDYPWKN